MAVTIQPYLRAGEPTVDETGGARFRQLVWPVGEWQHPEYGQLRITQDDIHELEQSFNAGIRALPGGSYPVEVEHGRVPGNVGYAERAEATAKGLVVEGRLTPDGVGHIASKRFPFWSPKRVPVNRPGMRWAFDSLSLVARPFYTNLDPVQLFSDPGECIGQVCITEDAMLLDPASDVATTTATAATTPTETGAEVQASAPEPVGTAAVAAEVAPTQAFADLQRRNAELEAELTAARAQAFGGELAGQNFGDAEAPRLMAPASRTALSQVLARLPHDLASEMMTVLRALRFYPPGEQGFSDAGPLPEPTTEVDRLHAGFMAQLNGEVS